MQKSLIAAAIFLAILPLAMVSAAGNIVGTQQFILTMAPGESIQSISINQSNNVAYISLAGKPSAKGSPITTTTAIPENFEYAPTAVTSIVIMYNSQQINPASYSVVVGVTGNTVNYNIALPTKHMIRYRTVTTVITNIITVPTTTVETLSWYIYYPAYPVNTVSISMHESGYFLGLSIGYYTVTTGSKGQVSTVYVPTVPAQRNITILWDPVSSKIVTGRITVSEMHILPMTDTEVVLSKTYTVTRNATIVQITIGQFNTETLIGMTRNGYNSEAVLIVYHNGSPQLTTYVVPSILRAMIDYFQLIKYGKQTIQWQGNGANAKPVIIVPYTAVFITNTYTGNATMYFGNKGGEYVIYNAVYSQTVYGDLMGVFKGTFNFTLTPGGYIAGMRYMTPIITSYTNVILATSTQYTTTTFVVPITGGMITSSTSTS